MIRFGCLSRIVPRRYAIIPWFVDGTDARTTGIWDWGSGIRGAMHARRNPDPATHLSDPGSPIPDPEMQVASSAGGKSRRPAHPRHRAATVAVPGPAAALPFAALAAFRHARIRRRPA